MNLNWKPAEPTPDFSANWTSQGVTVTYGDKIAGPFPNLDGINVIDVARTLSVDPKRLLEFKLTINNQEYVTKGLSDSDTAVGSDCYFDKKGAFIPKRLADEILGHYNFATMRDTKEIYVYHEGVYRPLAETLILEETQKALGDKCRNIHKREVVGFIQGATFTDRREFDRDLSFVGLKNGVYSLTTDQFTEYDPLNKITIQLPAEYNPNATCPNFLKFLNEVLPDETDRQAIIEFIGYCFYRGYPIQKAFMLVGEGSNGKSTLLLVLKALLGSDNITSRSLHDLEENRFAMAALYGKLANIFPDLPNRALANTTTFKMLTGGDPLTAEKKFRDGFNYVNYAKLIFSTNQIPISQDDTSAFYRRWIIINFPNKFEGENCDPNILAKLTTPEEISGIFNLAVKALGNLMARGTFINDRKTTEIAKEYIHRSDSVQAFVMDCVESAPDNRVKKQDVYGAYLSYCRMKNYPVVNDQTFYKRFLMHMRVEETRSNELGRPRLWIGIRLNESEEEVTSNLSNLSTHFPILCEVSNMNSDKEDKVEKTVDTSDTLDINPYGKNRKPICIECHRKGNYEQLGLAVVGQLPGDIKCADCGRNLATLLINLNEASI